MYGPEYAAARVHADPKWRYYKLPTGHDAWLTMPKATAELLLHSAAEGAHMRVPA